MNAATFHQRERVYLDDLIQRRLLALLVVMELVVVTVAIAWLYLEFRGVIEQGLYRIHHSDRHEAWPLLLASAWRAIGVLLLVNAVALLVADRIWARYVNRVLDRFGRLVERTAALDLGVDPEPAGLHRAVDLALAWRRYEHRIWCDVRSEVGALESAVAGPFDAAQVAECLARLERLLADTGAAGAPAVMDRDEGRTAPPDVTRIR
jgi:HAMP domain-containing protein